MGTNVFLRSEDPGTGIVVCGACAAGMVVMALAREDAFGSARAG